MKMTLQKLIFAIAAMLCVRLCSSANVSVTMLLANMYAIDSFGVKTPFFYSGGELTIRCQCNNCKDLNDLSIYNNDGRVTTIVDSEPNVIYAKVRLDKSTAFQTYDCTHGFMQAKSKFSVDYLICGEESDACQKTNCSESNAWNRFCIEKSPDERTCSTVPATTTCIGRSEIGVACVGKTDTTICDAFNQGSKINFIAKTKGQCGDTFTMKMTNGTEILIGSIGDYGSEFQPNYNKGSVKCEEKSNATPFAMVPSGSNFVSALKDQLTILTRTSCTDDNELVTFYFFNVRLQDFKLIFDRKNEKMMCSMVNMSDVKKPFRIQMEIYLNEHLVNSSQHPVLETEANCGHFVCTASLSVKTCAPIFESHKNQSGTADVVDNCVTVTSTGSNADSTTSGSMMLIIVIAIGASVVVLCLILTVTIIMVCRQKKHKAKKTWITQKGSSSTRSANRSSYKLDDRTGVLKDSELPLWGAFTYQELLIKISNDKTLNEAQRSSALKWLLETNQMKIMDRAEPQCLLPPPFEPPDFIEHYFASDAKKRSVQSPPPPVTRSIAVERARQLEKKNKQCKSTQRSSDDKQQPPRHNKKRNH